MTGTELISKYAAAESTTQMANYLAYRKNTVDLFSMPLDTAGDLTAITKSYRYIGMKVKVLNTDTDNIMTEYWWTGKEWKLVEQGKDYDDEIAEIQQILSGLQVSSATTIERISASTIIYTYTPKSGDPIDVETEEEAKNLADLSGGTYTVTEKVTEEKVVTNTYITDINVIGSDIEEPEE